MIRARILLVGAVLLAGAASAQAQGNSETRLGADASSCDIREAMTGARPADCPGATPSGGLASDGKLKVGVTRGLSFAKPKSAMAGTAAKAARAVGLTVPFASGSATLTTKARSTLDAVASALNAPELKSKKFVIEGHADAVGDADYNMRLSRDRADAARAYLVSNGGISGARLTSVGRGETEPYDPSNPTDAINRRVAVVPVN